MKTATTILGQNVRQLRKARGLSQRRLADLTGLSQYTISEIEMGNRDPHGSTLQKIAEALDVEITDLYGIDLPKEGAGIAPAPMQPPEGSPDRRIVETLKGLTEHLQQRLRAGEMTREEIDAHHRNHEVIAALLGPAMRAEAEELRRLFPNEHDVGPRAIIGPAVVRYVEAMIEMPDEAEGAEVIELDRDRRRAYGDLDKQAS